MADPFVGEIRMTAINYAPRDWAFCDGQSMPISQFSTLFSLLTTTFGGDGVNNFNLPDMRGRTPIHAGGQYPQGMIGGSETVYLTTASMPAHSHQIVVDNSADNAVKEPQGNFLGEADKVIYAEGGTTTLVPMGHTAITESGGGMRHSNLQPSTVINFIISLTGLYPSRT